MLRSLCVALAVATASPAFAEDEAPTTEPKVYEQEELAPVVLRHIPPRFSWNVGLAISYGMLPQFDRIPAWAGFGVRGGWGKHFGSHRIGFDIGFMFEGPIAVEWANTLEPAIGWDWIGPTGLFVGASVGPTLSVGTYLTPTQTLENRFDAGPFAAVRIGWSQPWSLVSRRFWVAVEPRFRWIAGQPSVVATLMFGTGNGY